MIVIIMDNARNGNFIRIYGFYSVAPALQTIASCCRKNVFSGGTVNSYKDHRLVMASAIAAIGAKEKISIQDPVAVEKSYPGFFEDYLNLGGRIYGINVG